MNIKILIAGFLFFFCSSLAASAEEDLSLIFEKVNHFEQLSPSIFSGHLRDDAKKIIQQGDNVEDYMLSLYGSKLVDSVITSYEENQIDIANKKHELTDQYFTLVFSQLNNWKKISHVNLGEIDFARWLYTSDSSYKQKAETHFKTAEELDIAELKMELEKRGNQPFYIGAAVFETEQQRKKPLSPAELYQADKASYAAYQHIARYEWALKTTQLENLKMTQEKRAGLIREAIQLYKESNQRLQPNTLSRAYWGILSSAQSSLDELHFAEFLDDYASYIKNKGSLAEQKRYAFDLLKSYVKAERIQEAHHWFKLFGEKERDDFQANRKFIPAELYLKICTYPTSQRILPPIFRKLAKELPHEFAEQDKKDCKLLKEILIEEDKWHYFLL